LPEVRHCAEPVLWVVGTGAMKTKVTLVLNWTYQLNNSGHKERSQTDVYTAFLSPEKLVEVVKYVHDWLYDSEPGKRRRPSLIKRAEEE